MVPGTGVEPIPWPCKDQTLPLHQPGLVLNFLKQGLQSSFPVFGSCSGRGMVLPHEEQDGEGPQGLDFFLGCTTSPHF